MNKPQLIAALYSFNAQRSGMDPRNYGSRESFMGDYRPMLQAGRDARTMIQYIARGEMITADQIVEASESEYSGRLSITEREDGIVVDYCTGQYFAVEYRAALCRVLAGAIRKAYLKAIRDPKATKVDYRQEQQKLIRFATNELGRGIAKRWFN